MRRHTFILRELGRYGWEYCGFDGDSYFVKRPAQSPPRDSFLITIEPVK